ncbi:hypothetical protein MKW92_030141, partial [Papaver armeniacum]
MADAASGDQQHKIVEIIKTNAYTVSKTVDGERDVHVTFLALSSDGKEVEVTNKQLKVENPQL